MQSFENFPRNAKPFGRRATPIEGPACVSGCTSEAALLPFDYYRAMAILDRQAKQTKRRDWELESAAHYVRKQALERGPYLADAEADLRDVLSRHDAKVAREDMERIGGVQP